MFTIDRTNLGQIPTYQSDTLRDSPPLSSIEKQHISFLNSLYANEDISQPIHAYDEALDLLKPIYNKNYIENKSKINFAFAINEFNQSAAYKKCHFIDWYSIQDYQYNSYTYINNMLISGADFNHHPSVVQLTLSLMHLSLFDNYHTQFTPTILYRGKVRKPVNIAHLQTNSVYKTTSFFSTAENLDNVIPLLKDKTTLANDEINTLCEIQYTEALTGANISRLFNNSKNEVLFWPNTEFIITNIRSTNDNKEVTIRMKTANVEQHEWDNRLHSLF